MLQKEKLLTWRDIRASALSATESPMHPPMSLPIPLVQVSSHGVISAVQDHVSFGEILGT